jgi:hypothetical protein
MIRRLALTSLSALSLACATASSEARLALTPVPEAPPDLDFQATGEVLTRDSSAAFNDWRVVGPHVNLTRREDGTWAGDIAHVNVVLTPSDGRLSGPTRTCTSCAGGTRWWCAGRSVAAASTSASSPATACRSPTASPAGIELRGLAARTRDPVMPQFGLALLAVRGMSVIMR